MDSDVGRRSYTDYIHFDLLPPLPHRSSILKCAPAVIPTTRTAPRFGSNILYKHYTSLTSSLLKLRTRPKKRRKLNKYQTKQNSGFVFPLDAVLNASQEEEDGDEHRVWFEDIIDPWLEELSRARREWELGHSDLDGLVDFPKSFRRKLSHTFPGEQHPTPSAP